MFSDREDELEYVLPKLRELKMMLGDIKDIDLEQMMKDYESEQFDLKIATELVEELIVKIGEQEAIEEEKLQASATNLRTLVKASTDLQNYNHPTTELVYYISVYLKAPNGLNNKLPLFDEDIKDLITHMENMMKTLLETPNHPHNTKRSLEKQVDVDTFVVMLGTAKVNYFKLNRTLRMVRCYVSNLLADHELLAERLQEAHYYVCGLSDSFLMEAREEDDRFIQEIFGKSTPDIQNILRNSLLDVMKKRGMPNLLESKRETIELSKQIEALMNHLKVINDLLTWFKDLRVSDKLTTIRSVDENLHVMKQKIHDHLKKSETSPYTDDMF